MKFLQKLIDCVQIVNGAELSVKTSKIVAGQEPEKTNEWLQAMYIAATSKKDFKGAIRKVLGMEGGAPEDKKEKREAKKEVKEERKEAAKPQGGNAKPQEPKPSEAKRAPPEAKQSSKPKREEAPQPQPAPKPAPGTFFQQ